MILYRPVGTKELQLIAKSGFKCFPPRLPEQPIFYPVLSKEYATEIASNWNVKYNDDHMGFVTQFEVDDEFVKKYEPHTVGASYHRELWVPAEELEKFNKHIIGTISVIAAFGTPHRDAIVKKYIPYVKEEDLIEYVKPILKAQGFKKKAKRWIKVTDHFTYIFFIQGSCYDKENYYVRPGILVNDIDPVPFLCYGHFFIDIPITTKEEILNQAEAFFSQWSSIDYLKKMVSSFVEWEKRNPL